MMRAASALVRDVRESRAAAAAAAATARRRLGVAPELALVFATPHFRRGAKGILETLRDSGCGPVVGGCAAGVMTDEGEVEGSPGLALLLLAGVPARPFAVSAPDALRASIADGGMALAFPDPAAVDLAEMMRAFEAGAGFVPLIGGALSGGTEKSGHFQFAGEQVQKGGICGIVFGRVATALGVAHGCRPIGRPLVITRSNGHMVLSLGGKPPLEALREVLETHAASGGKGGPVMAGIAMDATRSPLQRGDFIVRNLVAVKTPEGELLAVGTPVKTGQTLMFQLMDRESAVADMAEMVSSVRARLPQPPAFGLYVNCRGRGKNLYGETDHDVLALRTGLGELPFIGFYGNAEFAPMEARNWLHNYTGVFLAVGEAVGAEPGSRA